MACTLTKGRIEPSFAIKELFKHLMRGDVLNTDYEDFSLELLNEMIGKLGGYKKVAKALGKTNQAVYNWTTGRSKPDTANWIIIKKFIADRAKNDSADLES